MTLHPALDSHDTIQHAADSMSVPLPMLRSYISQYDEKDAARWMDVAENLKVGGASSLSVWLAKAVAHRILERLT